MRRLLLFAAFILIARLAGAQEVSGRAVESYEQYRFGDQLTTGLRQTYDLHLDRAFTMTSLVRLSLHAVDFQGSSNITDRLQSNSSLQVQPIGELFVNTTNIQAQLRSEIFETHANDGSQQSKRRIDQTSGQLTWQPDALPVFTVTGHHTLTNDDTAAIRLTDDNALAALAYGWHNLHASAGERYSHSGDPISGFDLTTTTHVAGLDYASTSFGGRLTVSADGSAQLARVNERAAAGTTSIPTQVAIGRALFGIDDTPTDDSDHPLDLAPALIDSNVGVSTGINLGPDGSSFYNIAVDLGRIDRVDEIDIIVRDAAGNPLHTGGGPITWDAYTSQDGQLWTPLVSQAAFNAPRSLYAISFDLLNGRWFKVVNFGVNSEATLVTEVQTYYHAGIPAGGRRSSTQNYYTGTANVTAHPTNSLTVSYTSNYSAVQQEIAAQRLRSSDLEHLVEVLYAPRSWMALRAQYINQSAQTFTNLNNRIDGLTTFLDWTPTRQLRTSFEVSRQKQALDGSLFTIDTTALHTTANVLRSLFVSMDIGTEKQTFSADQSTAQRRFASLTGNVQMFPTLRMLLTATLQQNDTQSTDPAVQLLGPSRDNRLATEFIWRPGRPLTIDVTLGHVSGQALSGFTQRYHVEWFPFASGTVSLGGSFDHDIDPVTSRKATRMIFNPRWVMNRWAMFDINYTAVSTSYASGRTAQRTLFTTLTLTK